MTTQNTMTSLETWVRQLNGELDVSQFSQSKAEKAAPSEYVKEFRLKLNSSNACQWILTNGTYSPKAKPNVRFTFDAKNKELISVEFLQGSYDD